MTDEILLNPVTGESMRIVESTLDVFIIEYALRPHGEIALEHFHPNIQQEISVRSGEMHIRVNGEHKVISAGESYIAPPSAQHFQWNPCDTEAIAIESYKPAARNHDFFRTLFGVARDGYTNAQGVPSPLLSAAIFSEFKDTIRPASAGARVLIALLAPISRALGYQRRIRKYARQA